MNPKRELIKRAAKIAKEKNGGQFNRQQLIDASKEVFNGFGEYHAGRSVGMKSIKTKDDIEDCRNAMALIDGHYPLTMSACCVVGINGGCSLDCPVYLDGECSEPQEFEGTFETKEEESLHVELYGEMNEDLDELSSPERYKRDKQFGVMVIIVIMLIGGYMIGANYEWW